MKLVLLSAALLLLLPAARPERHQRGSVSVPIAVVVQNLLHNKPSLTFTTSTADGGILLGGLRRLMKSNAGFTFGYSEHPDYGPFLESVNGLAGSDRDRTYWELLVRTADGRLLRPDVGIGCYVPKPKDQIILNFTRW
ncbi:unnamed protein product [Tetraodon nigroviridis]|uniref:Chromosome 16 SCAF14974, whole genome shotgun sequence n=1 Tax=Tetraodon nigroviridis TaxID=99883 RepID=Q4RYP3_TETNG|nr:unnamed protein product [Tetraodon nigroviridis]